MGDLDATIAAAGYRDTYIAQEHAPQRKSGGSQLSRDQKNKRQRERERERERENTLERKKQRVGRVPVKPGLKQKKEHMRAKKEGVGESQLSRDSNIANEGYMRCNRWVISMQREREKEHLSAQKTESGACLS